MKVLLTVWVATSQRENLGYLDHLIDWPASVPLPLVGDNVQIAPGEVKRVESRTLNPMRDSEPGVGLSLGQIYADDMDHLREPFASWERRSQPENGE